MHCSRRARRKASPLPIKAGKGFCAKTWLCRRVAQQHLGGTALEEGSASRRVSRAFIAGKAYQLRSKGGGGGKRYRAPRFFAHLLCRADGLSSFEGSFGRLARRALALSLRSPSRASSLTLAFFLKGLRKEWASLT
ncbi:hypothetical protein TRVL_09466 [Trypanosoma vivax]|nr:hypothetical protein TRVL_09466 [Trypanosoma vivax]